MGESSQLATHNTPNHVIFISSLINTLIINQVTKDKATAVVMALLLLRCDAAGPACRCLWSKSLFTRCGVAIIIRPLSLPMKNLFMMFRLSIFL